MDIDMDLLQWFFLYIYIYIYIYTKPSGGTVKNEIKSIKELKKPIIRKFKKRKAHSSFIDNIWHADLADMQLISTFNKVFIDIYSVIMCF